MLGYVAVYEAFKLTLKLVFGIKFEGIVGILFGKTPIC
jgi:hypothetical protein